MRGMIPMKKIMTAILAMILLMTMSLAMIMPVCATDLAEAEKKATELKKLGLFKGVSETDFDLDRAPTRIEALIMLIRVLGKESEAVNGDWSHPFTDVAAWADKYVGYAYEKGLTKGISAAEFGTGDANSDMYLAFVLRALSYDDSKGDFVWNEPDTLAKSVIRPGAIDVDNFLRADVVLVSWAALEANLKDGSQKLSEKLIDAGVFTAEDYSNAWQAEKEVGSQPLKNGEVNVSSFSEFQTAVENKDINVIYIGSDIEITSNYEFERNDDLAIYIQRESTVTVSEEFIPLFCTITNDGEMIINGTFDRACDFTNNGSITVKSGGIASSGMSNTNNCGDFIVDAGGKLHIERGSAFKNLGTLTNNGYISIKDGGSFNNLEGSIINNGTIDLYTYFDGDIKDITGTGTLNDNRE
jgi:hypothetical protein